LSTAPSLFTDLCARGLSLRTDGVQLVVTPGRLLDAPLRELIRANKAELMATAALHHVWTLLSERGRAHHARLPIRETDPEWPDLLRAYETLATALGADAVEQLGLGWEGGSDA
jgi:hypothetical protein